MKRDIFNHILPEAYFRRLCETDPDCFPAFTASMPTAGICGQSDPAN